MEKFKFLKKENIAKVPKSIGVYSFKKGGQFLYIGKSNNLKERIKTHFRKESLKDSLFINKVTQVGYIETDSEITALILEANLIKKEKPKYNVIWRDDKNFFFVGITKPARHRPKPQAWAGGEELPRVFTTHQPKIRDTGYEIRNTKFIGPFVEGSSLKKTLKLLRKIFPYYTIKKHPKVPCSWCHLGLCPGPEPNKEKYLKDLKNLISVLEGKRKSVFKKLKKEMYSASKAKDYEKAAEIRDQIRALERILSHAKIFERINPPIGGKKENWEKTEKELKKILKTKSKIFRIEAYDVSNIQGQKATGSMVTFIEGKSDKNLYRRFKIKVSGKPNDIAMIKEMLNRRLKHLEWGLADLILIDGGIAQLNAAIRIKNNKPVAPLPVSLRSNDKEGRNPDWFLFASQLRESRIKKIRVMAIAKRKNELYIEGQKKPLLLKNLPREIFNLILQLRDEAHRFALSYHQKLRKKDLLF